MRNFLCKIATFLVLFMIALIGLGIGIPYNQDGYLRAQKVKMDYLSSPDRDSTIVLLGGSNVAFGFDTRMLRDSLQRDVYNAGLHIDVGLRYLLDDCTQHLHAGDVLVISPEYEQFYGDTYDGHKEFADLFYLSHCHYPGTLSSKQIQALIENTPSYLKRKIEYTLFLAIGASWQSVYRLSSFNEYGDVVAHWYESYPQSTPTPCRLDQQGLTFNEKGFAHLIKNIEELESEGINVLMYPPTTLPSSLQESEKCINYIGERLRKVGHPFICSPSECQIEPALFLDSRYHLKHEGALLHTQQLLTQIQSR